MKTLFNMKDIFLAVILSAILVLVFSFPAHAQDKKPGFSKQAKIVVKIKKGKDEKTMVIDTTFNLNDLKSQKELDEYIKKIDGDLNGGSDKMKNMEVTVNIPDLPDSLDSDSLESHIICIKKGDKSPCIYMRKLPGGFDYKFDIPCCPDLSDLSGCCKKYMKFGNMPECKEKMRECEDRMKEFGEKEESLSDLLGDIPMDRVKSYKIKDTKNGKRIIIDVEDAPFFPRGKHRKMIIMSDPDNCHQFYFNNNPKSKVEKRIIIKSDIGGDD